MDKQLKNYLKKTWFEYKNAIGLPDPYTYLWGNPIKVHVPVDVAQNGVMIIGAYPTAHFYTMKGKDGKLITKVPVEDHLYPFSNEVYFDGSSFDSIKSGNEIENHFLKPLKIQRQDCWITDLVKVFLFKQGHINRYEKLGFTGFKANRNKFKQYAKLSLPFIREEIKLARPKVIICLGAEVNAVIHKLSLKAATQIISKNPIKKDIDGTEFLFFACPHPGILMRNEEKGEKWRTILNETLVEVAKIIET